MFESKLSNYLLWQYRKLCLRYATGINMNILLIIVILGFIWRMVIGYRRGMVKELQGFFTFLVSSISIALVCKAVKSYFASETVNLIIAVLLLIILGIVFKLLKLVFFPAEAIVKLPVIHFADKILGIVLGVLEVAVMLWAFFLVLSIFSAGIFGKILEAYIYDSSFLTYLYQHNLLEKIFEQISVSIHEVV